MKRMKGLYLIIYTVAAVMLLSIACTEVELVDTSSRRQYSPLRLSFDWQGAEKDKPDRMQLIAVRNVKTWRAHGFVDTEDGRNPWFGYSEPLIEEDSPLNPGTGTGEGEGAEPGMGRNGTDTGTGEGETGGDTDEGGTDEGEGNPNEGETPEGGEETPDDTDPEPIDPDTRYPFLLKGGEYNMLVVNFGVSTDNMELKCLRDGQAATASEDGTPEGGSTPPGEETKPGGETPQEDGSLKEYLNDHTRRANELFLCIKPLKDRPEAVRDKDLPDFNPKFEYIDSVPPIFYALKNGVRAVPGIDTEVQLQMEPISQEVRIKFTVELKGDESGNHVPQVAELPIVEMSGICGHFNLMEAYVDTTTLYRSAVTAELESDEGNRKVYVARFHTLGMIPSYNATYLNGPGVFQVAIKAVSTDPNSPNKEGRYVYAGINPRTELMESQIIVEGPDGKPRMRFSREPVIVEIQTPLVINYKFLVDAGEGLGWGQKKPTDIDIDI